MTPEQIKMLQAPLDPRHIKPPPPGKYGTYVDGHHIVTEANRIFCHDGWSYSVEELRLTNAGMNGDKHHVGYVAIVKVLVDGVYRTGVGHGSGDAKREGDAHESALKEAETDALKRALRTFGNTFGLALYDKGDAPEIGIPPVQLPAGPINDETRDWLAGKIDTTGKPVGEFCAAFNVTSLKEITYEQMQDAKTWVRDNRKAA